MAGPVATLILLLAAALAVRPTVQDAQPSILAFVNARIIDGSGGAPKRNGAMVVQDGGVTTVFSLGGDGPAGIQVRDEKAAGLARLFVAGPVIANADPAAARTAVDGVKAMNAEGRTSRPAETSSRTASGTYPSTMRLSNSYEARIAACRRR